MDVYHHDIFIIHLISRLLLTKIKNNICLYTVQWIIATISISSNNYFDALYSLITFSKYSSKYS